MKVALLTCEKLPNLTANDQLVYNHLMEKKIDVEIAIWSDETVKWNKYDLLIFRNTWDYFEREKEFIKWLNSIESLGIKTLNSLTTIKWNIHKFYLGELASKDIPIIPTLFISKGSSFVLQEMKPSEWSKGVIKPAFSAGSYLTEVVTDDNIESLDLTYNEIVQTKDLLFQKYMPEIETIGETSFIFFNRVYSHAVNKTPKDGDFRIQSQFGGKYVEAKLEDNIVAQAQKVIDSIEGDLLYTRVDGIVIDEVLYLMEVELIEPDLYLDRTEGATERFANAIIERCG